MSKPTARQQMIKLAQELPEDATFEEAMDQLYLLLKVERGLAQADSGKKISQEEARRRIDRWLK